MTFENLDNPQERLRVLHRCEKVYYFPNGDIITSDRNVVPNVPIDNIDKKRLESFYRRVYYQYSQNACEDCREHALIMLDIEFGRFLGYIERGMEETID